MAYGYYIAVKCEPSSQSQLVATRTQGMSHIVKVCVVPYTVGLCECLIVKAGAADSGGQEGQPTKSMRGKTIFLLLHLAASAG